MTPTDRARWLAAYARNEDIDICYEVQDNNWFARTIYHEGSDGIDYTYLEAPTLPELLRALLEVFE